jgi:formate dehydrogenase major subunit
MLGAGAATNSFDDIERAQAILLWGCNPTENHPVVGARIKQAVLRGAKLIVIDPRQTELADYSTVHLQLKPGTDVALANAMAAVIVAEKLIDAKFTRQHVLEYAEFADFVGSQPTARACTITGISWDKIVLAARLYASVKPAMCFHGLGVTEQTQGTEGVQCIVNLALLTGNIGSPGAGVNPLRGQNNVQGAAHMGCEPTRLPGYLPIESAASMCEPVWGAAVPRSRGRNLLEMLRGADSGELRAIYAIGYDILLTNPNLNATVRALRKLDLVLVQDLFLNETAKEVGTVFLPACSSFEKGGTFMNAERRVQRIRPALVPLDESRPDWQVICNLAAQLGHGGSFDYSSEEEVWNEVRKVWQAGSGMTYARLDKLGLQWPCYDESDPGTTILHEAGSFSSGKPAALARIPYRPSPETCSPAFPMTLVTGRSLYQFNAGTMTGRTPNNELRASDCLDISPADAESLKIQTGDTVEVSSQYGTAVLPAQVTTSLPAGVTFATFQTPPVRLNTVTSTHHDNACATPEYKQAAVRLIPK